MIIKPISLAALSLLSLAVCASAYANPISITNNGGAVALGGTTSAGLVSFTNGTLVASASGTITGVPPTFPPGLVSTFSANYSEKVYTDATNPLGANDLVFEMSFTNSAGSNDALETVTNGYLSGFSNFLVDVGYFGSADVPSSASESNGTVDFFFPSPASVAPGASSDTLVIFTNATAVAPGTFSLIDSETGTSSGFIPAAAPSATPEPSSLILLGTGILGVAGAARRKYMKR